MLIMGTEEVSAYPLFTLMVTWLTGSIPTAQHHEGIGHLTSLGKDPNSKSKVRFLLNAYHFGTFV